jgi:molybdopterin molybdotransferase
MVADSEIQRKARLTPLHEVLASFDTAVGPVAPHEEDLQAALGRTLAADIVIPQGHPAAALALRDGFAVRANTTTGANSHVPTPLSPAPARVDLGESLPAGTDAVAPFDMVTAKGETLAPVAPGEGVLPAHSDAPAGHRLFLTGGRLRRVDIGMLTALGIGRVTIRVPRVRIVRAGDGRSIEGGTALIASAIDAEGGMAMPDHGTLAAALESSDSDAIVAIGGTGSGRSDASVRTLARIGSVAVHGIGIAPGETTAFGHVGRRPVLLLPGRFDAALAGWLTVGRRMLAKLCFRLMVEQPFTAELRRKIASPLGLAEIVPVRRHGFKIEPLAGGYLPLQALARAEGWILIPADSEGHSEGTVVTVRPWP